MEHLNISNNGIITDDGICNMTKMIRLDLEFNINITDNGIKNMINI